jgi:UDP-N-acetyl-D-galactosamine dehydrogenase
MQEGHIPDVILAGRKINDNMPVYIAERLLERLALDAPLRPGLKCLVLGFTFKEDCSDVRNTKVLKMTECIARAGLSVDVYDPFLSDEFVFPNGARGVSLLEPGRYDAIVIAVPHAIFKQWGIDKIKAYGTSESIVFDIKSIFPRNSVDIQL